MNEWQSQSLSFFLTNALLYISINHLLACLQAMAMELPVIVTAYSGPGDYISAENAFPGTPCPGNIFVFLKFYFSFIFCILMYAFFVVALVLLQLK
jgi:hypothetical protein